MFHYISAKVHTTAVKARESIEDRLASRMRGRDGEAGLEAIEVVVLSVIALGIVIALGAAIRTLVNRYMGDIVNAPDLPGVGD